MVSDIKAAERRIKTSMDTLRGLGKCSTLADFAAMLITADELHSAIGVIYDKLYYDSLGSGIIGRSERNPFPDRDDPSRPNSPIGSDTSHI